MKTLSQKLNEVLIENTMTKSLNEEHSLQCKALTENKEQETNIIDDESPLKENQEEIQ